MGYILIFIPLLVFTIINVIKKNNLLALVLSYSIIVSQFVLVTFFGNNIITNYVKVYGTGFKLNCLIDQLTIVMLMMISIVYFVTFMITNSTIKDDDKKFNAFNLLLLALMATNGLVMVNDFFTMYVFIEVVSATSYIQIVQSKDKYALEGGFKYLILSAVATTTILASTTLIFMMCGDTSFPVVKEFVRNNPNNIVILISLIFIVTGLFLKAGIVPFNGWLPDAYTGAPSAISVLLSGIATKTLGLYTLIRLIVSVFGFSPKLQGVFLVFGLLTIIVGAMFAIGQNNLKRMLAYSSISQTGYIILALGALAPNKTLGVLGAVFHMFSHAISKTQLFINGAAIEEQAGTVEMDKLEGIAQKMPVTGWTSVMGMLSISGIPPFLGFWSKLIIVIALFQSNLYFYGSAAIILSIITLAYYLNMQKKMFFGKIKDELTNLSEAKIGMTLPAILLSAVSFIVGIFFTLIFYNYIIPIQYIIK